MNDNWQQQSDCKEDIVTRLYSRRIKQKLETSHAIFTWLLATEFFSTLHIATITNLSIYVIPNILSINSLNCIYFCFVKFCSVSYIETIAEVFYSANYWSSIIKSKNSSEILSNTCVFSVFKTKCEWKCQNELFF